MSEFTVLLSNKAEKGLRKAEAKTRKRLQEALDFLKLNPVPTQEFDVTKISASKANYRIKIGRYRILYTIIWEQRLVKVFDIDRRDENTYG